MRGSATLPMARPAEESAPAQFSPSGAPPARGASGRTAGSPFAALAGIKFERAYERHACGSISGCGFARFARTRTSAAKIIVTEAGSA